MKPESPAAYRLQAESANRRPRATDLPDELWQAVLAHNSPLDLVQAAGVSRRWRHLAQASSVSRAVLRNTGSLSAPVPSAWPDQPAAMRLAAKVRAEACYQQHTAAGPMLLRQSLPDFDSGLNRHLALSSGDRWLGIASGQGSPSWDIIDLEDIRRPSLHLFDPPLGIIDIAFAPNERWVAAMGESGLVQHHALTGGHMRPLCQTQHLSAVRVGAYSSDSLKFASVDDQSVRVQCITQPEAAPVCYRLPMQVALEKVAFANNDTTLLVQDHHSVTLIDLTAPAAPVAVQNIRIFHAYPRAAFLTEGQLRVVVWEDDGTTGFYDGKKAIFAENNYRNIPISGDDTWDTEAQVSPDMAWVVKNGREQHDTGRFASTLLFDMRQTPQDHSGFEFSELRHAPRPYAEAHFASRGNRLLLLSEMDEHEPCHALLLYDLNNLRKKPWLGALGYNIHEAALSQDGRRAFTLCEQGDVLMWALPSVSETSVESDPCLSPASAGALNSGGNDRQNQVGTAQFLR